ncbi:hypothetical protein ACHAWF_017115 [Thalassiosira exigua]
MTTATLPPAPPPSRSGGGASATMVSLPPPAGGGPSAPSSATAAASSSSAGPPTPDPEALLDALDAFSSSGAGGIGGRYAPSTTPSSQSKGPTTSAPSSAGEGGSAREPEDDFDPVEFLNRHYRTEAQLAAALPDLRSAISSRLERLDDGLSTTLRRQAALAPGLARDVARARAASVQLARRVREVRDVARTSEAAVLEITRDMKRLDHAKRHLQRTITALKRLHMLLHAAEQLRAAAAVTPEQPVPRYEAAAHLVDATRLLLGHFEGYVDSVPKMRQVRDAVGIIKGQLWEGIVRLFREAGRQVEEPRLERSIVADGGEMGGGGEGGAAAAGAAAGPVVTPPSSMVQKTLADACLVVEALGPQSRERFVADFVKDHLREYEQRYNPSPAAAMAKKGGTPAGKSFKKSVSPDSEAGSDGNGGNNNNNSGVQPASLETVDARFAWYRTKLRSLQVQFAGVFPLHWNVHYRLTARFLEVSARHLKFVLKKHYNKNVVRIPAFKGGTDSGAGSSSSAAASIAAGINPKFVSLSVSTHGKSSHGGSAGGGTGGGPAADADVLAEGEKAVTALLKALQRAILFEKEMTAWLARDCGTKFVDPTKKKEGEEAAGGTSSATKKGWGGGGDDDDLEFDERGRAVAAGSAEGIKIKYERRRRAAVAGGGTDSSSATVDGAARGTAGGPVPPLLGLASSVFDAHMSPYVALEERSMDETLHAAASDDTVDARGERPVFVSSTNLFIYMKNSITRCTALTKEKTFFLLQRSFQKKLRGYAAVLEKKLPPAVSTQNVVAKMTLSGGGGHAPGAAGVVYRIPPGGEATVCHVVDTCEYCADTVEALEDLIRDKIGDKYKDKVDMSEEQGAFQDVTAKSIRVLVSGLEQRLDGPLREMSRTGWSTFDMVGEEPSYVRGVHLAVHPFVVTVRGLIPSSYFRSFCDKFALAFAATYYRTLVGLKRISEAGTQQLLLDVYSIKTLMLKLPVLEAEKRTIASGPGSGPRHGAADLAGGATVAPAMYTKMVNREFRKLEVTLKLVGSPRDMLVDMFRAQWDCSIDTSAMAGDFTTILNLKGIPRAEHGSLLEALGVEAGEAGAGAGVGAGDPSGSVTAKMQELQERGSDVAAKVNADLNQMRQRVDDFRKAFR